MTARPVTSGAAAIVGLGLILTLAARTTGAGWLIVLLCVIVGMLVVATIWPLVAVRLAQVTVTGPADATAGEPIELHAIVRRRGLGVAIRADAGDWVSAVDDPDVPLDYIPERRGLVAAVQLTVASGAPFGLIWGRRTRAVSLSRPVVVAPRRAARARLAPPTGGSDGDGGTTIPLTGDRLRSVREHLPGDPMRLVHWPATARRGSLVVKELEDAQRPRLHVVVSLTGNRERDDGVAEDAMGAVCDALEAGREVTLHTVDADGPHSTDIHTPLDAGRRLAVATRGTPPVPIDAGAALLHLGDGERR